MALYLGLSLNSKHNTKSFGAQIAEKVGEMLIYCRHSHISKGSHYTLIEASLSNLPIYYLSLFPISSKVSALIDQLYSNIFWKSRKDKSSYHLLGWAKVKLPIH